MPDNTKRGAVLEARKLDLLGVRCPVNWARAKTALEGMARGERVELIADDPRAFTDIPAAAEAEGYAVLDARINRGIVRILIER